jgi:hypothetical protein
MLSQTNNFHGIRKEIKNEGSKKQLEKQIKRRERLREEHRLRVFKNSVYAEENISTEER